MSLLFRQARPDDAQAISTLVRALATPFFEFEDQRGEEGFLDSISCSSERTYLSLPGYWYWMAEHNNALAGFIGIRDNTHIFHLFVSPDSQSKGLGSTLLGYALDHIRDNGNHTQLTVNAAITARGFYSRHGFLPTAEVQITNGVRYLPMRKLLNTHEHS